MGRPLQSRLLGNSSDPQSHEPMTTSRIHWLIKARLVLAFFSLTLISSLSFHANAGQMSVYPLRVEFGPGKAGEALTIRNVGTTPLIVQPTVMKWSQENGIDKFEATKEVLVAPALVEIPPGETQIVRLALRRTADPSGQLTYRVFLREVPGAEKKTGTQITILLNVSLPVFVSAAQPNAKPLAFSAAALDNLEGVAVTNPGSSHIQFKSLSVKDSRGGQNEFETMFYLLGGQTRTLPFPNKKKLAPGAWQLNAKTDQGDLSTGTSIK
jgi:fimbrial chaperone protein